MRLLVVNPNTTAAMTERLVAVGSSVASPGTRIVGATASRGVPYIASRAEAQLAGAEALDLIANAEPGIDAAIIAAFGDPGLPAARTLFDRPVIGMSEAAMLTACMLGDRFAIVTFSASLTRWYTDCVAMHGLAGRCAGIHVPDAPFSSVATVQDELASALVAAANDAVATTGADVVILAGAPLAGLAGRVASRIAVPVVDPIAAAILQAEALVRLGGLSGRPRERTGKPSIGYSPALARRLAGEPEPLA